MSTIITPSEEQINIVVNDEKISINVESGDVIVNVNEQIVEVSTVNGGYPLPTTVYSVFGRTGNIIATEGDYDLGELGDVTLVSSTNGDVLTYDGTKWINKAVTGTGTVTSVDMSVPVGLQVSGNPITINGTLALNYAAGYSLPTTAKQTTWDTAYNDSIVSASVSGTTTKTLTLNQQDGGTITASWTDIDTNLVTSVNGYVGTVVLTTSDIAEGSRLYYTETRVSNNVDVAANTAARHSAVTIGTANGLSLASQVLSLALASASTTGALSSTDWATFNNKVPYSGATGNVTLGEYQLSAGQVAFDQSPTGTAGVGILRWNDSDGTLDLGLKGGNVTLQVGQEIVARVVNKTGADLLESGYKVVRISSAQGQRLAVQLAQANNDTNSTDTIGIVTETIVNNQEGFITILGQVKEINTTGSLQGETWADGDVLYLSPTTAGNITNIKPIAPSHMVVVGYVEYAHSQHGKIYCKTQNGYELEELHDCYLPTYVSNGVLYRDTTNNLWKNASIATVLGYTPISLTSLSGVSPLSYDNTTGAFSIAQATTSANGYLSSTDWNTFNNKQTAGNYITALSGEATASGPGSAAVTLSTSAVTGKLLTGVNITGGSISATDSILVAFGKIQNQINGVLGGAIYQSVWNASTNSPTLASGTGTKGYYYIVSVAGSTNLDGITDWKVGDWAIFNGTTWNKVDNSDAVSSVNGYTGAVSLTTANISEVTNLYYTDVRVSANTDVAANTAARHAAVTLGTANGLSLSTQQLSLGLASTSATGALSSTDWNTFNLKQAGSTNLTSLAALTYASTSFVKMTASGTFALDTSVYYLASNPNGYTTNVGTVTSVAALTIGTSGTDLSSTVANSTTTPVITLNVPDASATNRGALSSTDWTTFNNKQGTITLTTTGTSGAATFTSNTLNIPNYGSALSGYLPLTGGTLTGALNINLSSGTALNVAGNAIFRGDTGVATPRQLIIQSGGSTPVYLEAKGYGANYQTDFGIRTYNNVGTAFEVFYADSSGRVGINQVSPSYQLDVNGTFRVTSDATLGGSSTIFGTTGSKFYVYPAFSTNLNLLQNYNGSAYTTEEHRASDYSFKIGTTPALTIASTGAATFSSSVDAGGGFISNNDSNTPVGFYKLRPNASITSARWWRMTSDNLVYGDFSISQSAANSDASYTPKLYINASGNVGIGTTSPASGRKLTVAGGAQFTYTDNGGASFNIVPGTNGQDGADFNLSYYTGTGYGPLTFTLGGSERMRITSGGNVLIGTTTDSGFKLYVNGIGKFNGPDSNWGLIVQNDYSGSGQSYGLKVRAGTSSGVDATFVLQDYAGTEFFTARGNGKIGIGTNSPQALLQVTSSSFPVLKVADGIGGGALALGDSAISSNYVGIWRGAANSISGGGFLNIQGNGIAFMSSDNVFGSGTERMRIHSNGNISIGNPTNTGDLLYLAGNLKMITNGKIDSNGGYLAINSATGGNVLIGTTDDGSGARLLSYSTTAASQIKAAGTAPAITFSNTITSPTIGGVLGAATAANHFITGTAAGDMVLANQFTAGALIFGTSNAEKVRLTSTGYLKASNSGSYLGSTGAYHELRSNASDMVSYITNTNATPFGIEVNFTAATPNNTSSTFFIGRDSTTARFRLYSNGGLANYQANDVNLSDERTKKDIIPLESYWDKFKGIEIVKFKYKNQTHDDFNIGVIAQQVEEIAPEFVDTDGWGETPKDGIPLKSVYTADLHHATIKVLQECMAKIDEQQKEINELKLKIK